MADETPPPRKPSKYLIVAFRGNHFEGYVAKDKNVRRIGSYPARSAFTLDVAETEAEMLGRCCAHVGMTFHPIMDPEKTRESA